MTYWQYAEIRRLWSEGKNTFEIGEATGISEAAVHGAITRWIGARKAGRAA